MCSLFYIEAIQLSLKSRNLMPAQTHFTAPPNACIHCTAQFMHRQARYYPGDAWPCVRMDMDRGRAGVQLKSSNKQSSSILAPITSRQTLNGDARYSNMNPWWIRVRWNVKPNCAITSCIRSRIRGQLLRGESCRNIWRAYFQKGLDPFSWLWSKTRFSVGVCTRVYGNLNIEFTIFCLLVTFGLKMRFKGKG